MNIALIAHDEKKELMVQFCIAYCGVLSRNNLCATGTTGKMVSEATGLTIQKFLAGSQGGSQQIAARIACNEIDMLLFFRDPLNPKPNEPNDMNMLRLCTIFLLLQTSQPQRYLFTVLSVATLTGEIF